MSSQSCRQFLGTLDLYLDKELSSAETSQIAEHLKECQECFSEVETRRAIRERLRSAVRNVPAAPALEAAIQATLRVNRPSSRSRSYWVALPIAAAIVICMSAALAYRFGYLRLTKGSQESYVASISAPIPGIMRVGLGDHVHCAVYKAFSNQHPTLEQMAHDMGQYKELTSVIEKKIPRTYRVLLAHQCRYHGRRFVHVELTNGSALVSLVISRRGEGDSFEKDQLIPVLTESGIAIYQTKAQRFEVSGSETRDYLIYVVSNLGQDDNLNMMLALAPSVTSFLQSIPG